MILNQIFMPNDNINNEYVNYNNKLKPRKIFESDSLKIFFEKYKSTIMDIFYKEINLYLNDDLLCNNEENMFPKKSILDGKYYISSFSISKYSKKYIYISIEANFLGDFNNKLDDYLGLEVVILFNKEKTNFILDGVNSFVI